MGTLCAVALGGLAGWLAAEPEGNVLTTGADVAREKSQNIRALDVTALGPFLIFLGVVGVASRSARFVLAFAGAATVTFNGRNFLANEQAGR